MTCFDIGEHRTVFEIMNLGVEIVLAVQLFSSVHTVVSLQKYVFGLTEYLS